MKRTDDFIEGLPKAELHLHLEGSLEPEQLFDLAGRNKIDIPFQTIDDVRAAYNFANLQDFLDIYYQGMNVLRTEQDFFDLTMAYCRRVHADNCRHVEVFFDPQGHTERDVPFQVFIDGIAGALRVAEKELGMTSKLIMCFLRHLSEEAALETLNLAEPYLDRIAGVGLDSSEVGHPPSKFVNVFKRAGDMGLLRVAHAGEEGPPGYVWEAIDMLEVDRIDHGNRALEDSKLVARLVDAKMTLTVCPLSNTKLCVVKDMTDHPLKKMLDSGLRATINSDDPSYFGGYLNDNYRAVAGALALSKEDLTTLAVNSFLGSFLSPDEKAAHIKRVTDYADEFGADE